jgi:hypothetical protein
MILVLGLRWWYGIGWQWAIKRALTNRLVRAGQTFSILPLAKTLFSPFKQTYQRGVKGPLDLKIHVFLDNIVSRVIGFLARSTIITAGLFYSVYVLISGIIFMIIWPLLPLSLVVSLILMAAGVGK